jgi:hypothetical protein
VFDGGAERAVGGVAGAVVAAVAGGAGGRDGTRGRDYEPVEPDCGDRGADCDGVHQRVDALVCRGVRVGGGDPAGGDCELCGAAGADRADRACDLGSGVRRSRLRLGVGYPPGGWWY